MKPLSALAALFFSVAIAWPTSAHAGPGHDHGHDHGAAAAAPSGPALPRFAAVSEAFELVGVLNGQQITLYLDRATDNAPVSGATIELEIAGTTFKAEARDDTYVVQLPALPKPGVLPIVATVTAGTEVDLLAGELNLNADGHGDGHADGHAHDAGHTHTGLAHAASHVKAHAKEYAAWAVGALAALVVIVVMGRRWAARRQASRGATA